MIPVPYIHTSVLLHYFSFILKFLSEQCLRISRSRDQGILFASHRCLFSFYFPTLPFPLVFLQFSIHLFFPSIHYLVIRIRVQENNYLIIYFTPTLKFLCLRSLSFHLLSKFKCYGYKLYSEFTSAALIFMQLFHFPQCLNSIVVLSPNQR